MKNHNTKKHLLQKGGALIIFVLILLLAGTAALFSILDGHSMKLARNKKTYASLAEAKEALIGYSLRQTSQPGTFPCPDIDNDGMSNGLIGGCTGFIGRLPWKQLQVDMLKDSYSQCLWYALSPTFNEEVQESSRSLNPINGNAAGTISLVDDLDTPISSINPVIAVIIAPNNPVNGQNRRNALTNYCEGDSLPAHYLDAKGAVNNATGNVTGNKYTFKMGSPSFDFNDQIVYITAHEFYPLLRKRIAKEMIGKVNVPSGLFDYYQSPISAPQNKYPCPALTIGGHPEVCSETPAIPIIGYIPYNDLQYITLGTWLIDNNWFAMTSYIYISASHVKVTVSDSSGSYSCDANMNAVSCSSP